MKSKKKFNSTIWKIIHNLKNYWIFWVFKGFLKNEKVNSKIKWSNNSSFVILIFAIWKFRNIIVLHFIVPNLDPPSAIVHCKILRKNEVIKYCIEKMTHYLYLIIFFLENVNENSIEIHFLQLSQKFEHL